MCVGIPGRILAIGTEHPHLGRVEIQGLVRDINLGLIAQDGPRPGDWVDVHMGMAVALVSEEEARETLAFLKRLGSL